ncbi:MAG: hypothetical protein IKS40_09070 [Treponema sp.]|nr:hypothetical protein [Treponema sp.]
MEQIMSIIQTMLAFLALIAATWIPHKIKWEQMYSSLLDEYRSFDYAIALQRIIEFFVTECKNDVNNIKPLYRKHFEEEIMDKKGDIKKENCLHFQRRLLAQFFWQLNQCANSFAIGKRRIAQDFTSSEAKLIKILIYIGEVIDNDETGILYKDISSDERVRKIEHYKGQNKSLAEIYHILKNSKRFIS